MPAALPIFSVRAAMARISFVQRGASSPSVGAEGRGAGDALGNGRRTDRRQRRGAGGRCRRRAAPGARTGSGRRRGRAVAGFGLLRLLVGLAATVLRPVERRRDLVRVVLVPAQEDDRTAHLFV